MSSSVNRLNTAVTTHQMSIFSPQNLPKPFGGRAVRSPAPLAGFKGSSGKGKEGKGEERREEGRERRIGYPTF